jgi:hypothetical protein
MKEYTISEILHIAADNHLAVKESETWNRGGNKEKFSCCAMHEAVIDLSRTFTFDEIDEVVCRIIEGLEEMGCPTNSLDAFDDNGEFKEENQQIRYAWLKFAAIIAEEQGV